MFQYSLGHAIADGFVKVPVIAYRKDGMTDDRTQLRDACLLLAHKADAYSQYRSEAPGAPVVNPILFVVCTDIEHAERTASLLATDGYIGDSDAILLIHSQSDDEALQLLSDVERPDSPIRAIVSGQ